jgi:hypothetical protein
LLERSRAALQRMLDYGFLFKNNGPLEG